MSKNRETSMLKTNVQLMIGALSIAFALGLATSRVGMTSPQDVAMAKGTTEPTVSAATETNSDYFPARFVNKGTKIEAPIPQF